MDADERVAQNRQRSGKGHPWDHPREVALMGVSAAAG